MRLARLLATGLLLPVLVFAVYGPGLTGGFVFDDQANIVENDYVTSGNLDLDGLLAVAVSGRAGPLGRPLSMVSFALDHARAGIRPLPYKVTNLVIHCLNAWLVYLVARLLLATPAFAAGRARTADDHHPIALAAALVFALHPVNLTTVLYVVQRMTSLATLWMLAGVAFYLWQRARLAAGRGSVAVLAAGTLVCTVLASAAKEIGVLLPLLAGACEFTLYRQRPARGARALDAYLFATVALPLAGAAVFLLARPDWLLAPYVIREYTLTDRLLTESRVLWLYLAQWLAPRPAAFALFHDDFPLSTGLFEPPATALALAGLAGAVAAAWIARRRAPLLGFAVAWFLVAHALESTFIALELIHEHRNYPALVGPAIALAAWAWRGGARPRLARAARLALCGWIALSALVTYARAHQWSDPLTLALAEVDYHPDSYRTQYELARVYYALYERDGDARQYALAREHFLRAAALDRDAPLPYVALVQHAFLRDGAPDPDWLRELHARLRDGALHPNVVAGLSNLVDCHARGRCRLAPQTMLDLFGAAVGNPTLDGHSRALVLTQLAAYYSNVAGDLPSALGVMREVVKEYPDMVVNRTNLARFLMAAGEHDEALAVLAQARDLVDRTQGALRGRPLRAEIDALAAQARAGAPHADR